RFARRIFRPHPEEPAPQGGRLEGRGRPPTPEGSHAVGGRLGGMSMAGLEGEKFRRGPGGPPTRQGAARRPNNLIATAFRLFVDKGWDGASIDEIARQAGVAKRFIYARYPDKKALLVGAIERLLDEHVGALQVAEPLPDDVEEGLIVFGRRLLDLALKPETLAFQRRFFADVDRYPDLARQFV